MSNIQRLRAALGNQRLGIATDEDEQLLASLPYASAPVGNPGNVEAPRVEQPVQPVSVTQQGPSGPVDGVQTQWDIGGPVGDVVAPTGRSHARNAQALRSENLADANEQGRLHTTIGDMESDMFGKQSGVLGQRKDFVKGERESAQAEVERRRARERSIEDDIDARRKEMQKMVDKPPRDTMVHVWGAIANVMMNSPKRPGASGNHAAAAAAAQMLGGMQQSKIQAHYKKLEGLGMLQNDDRSTLASSHAAKINDLEASSKIIQLQALETDAALKEIETGHYSDKAKAVAKQTRLEFNRQVRDNLIKLEEQRAQQQASLRAGQQDDALWRVPTAELIAMNQAGKLGKRGQEILAQKIKNDQTARAGEANIESTRADTAKKLADSEHGPKLTEGQQKMDIQVAGAQESYERLLPYHRRPDGTAMDFSKDKPDLPSYGVTRGAWVPDALVPEDNLQFRADTRAMVMAILRGESGANVPEHEIDNKIRGLGLDSTDEAVRMRGLQQLAQQFEAMDVRGRLKGGVQNRGNAPAGPDPRVRPGFASPSAASRGLNRDAGGQFTLPNVQLQDVQLEEARRRGLLK